jgi:hypothetical protein
MGVLRSKRSFLNGLKQVQSDPMISAEDKLDIIIALSRAFAEGEKGFGESDTGWGGNICAPSRGERAATVAVVGRGERRDSLEVSGGGWEVWWHGACL